MKYNEKKRKAYFLLKEEVNNWIHSNFDEMSEKDVRGLLDFIHKQWWHLNDLVMDINDRTTEIIKKFNIVRPYEDKRR